MLNSTGEDDAWYLYVTAINSKGERISASQKWEEIREEGLHSQRSGIKFQLGCARKNKLLL